MEPIAVIASGALRGRRQVSVLGGSFVSFQGIPYAKPPIGKLRFQPPVPVDPWSGVRDALIEGAPAPAFHMVTRHYLKHSSEDCLFLNVYTPQMPGPSFRAGKAVLFWIHGGLFSSGSGDSDLYGPDYLLQHDVVLVTCNYRLGALGFLSLETPECPGNFGLKDIMAALQWVQDNICIFGGDPKNVTIFGESAGGGVVQYLMMSKAATGLFHKGISQSGAATNAWSRAENPRERAFKLGELLGCHASDDLALLNFLKGVSPEELVLASDKVLPLVKPSEHFLNKAFVPCVEPNVPGGLVYQEPDVLLQAGQCRRMPYMIGFNSLEGLIMLEAGKPIPKLHTDEHLEWLIPADLDVAPGSKAAKNIVDKIRRFYFPQGFDEGKLIDAFSASYVLYEIEKTISALSNLDMPMYVYRFGFDGGLGLRRFYGYDDKWPGACHSDEMGYLFKINMFPQKLVPGSKDFLMMQTMTKLWTDFAKNGDPTPESRLWTPATASNLACLEIDEELTLQTDRDRSEVEFWKEIHLAEKADSGPVVH